MTDTIFALSTAPGKSGVAVIRVSGSAAWETLSAFSADAPPPAPRKAVLRTLTHEGDIIDRAMVIGFKGPESFTGEDVVEYHLHGSLAVINAMTEALSIIKGCRMAEPGEFTRRAFENGKMDLTEAEAVADLIDAETIAQKNQALSQMEGALSRLYNGWAEDLTKSLAYVEAVIDFPDEDVSDDETAKVRPAVEKLLGDISAHLKDNHRGERLRHGIQVAVVGAPNAGKSSLVNALARRDVAIVSDLAGTTRDVIEVHLDLGGYPVILADTAGLRPEQIGDSGQDSIESEGIRRALKRAEDADLRVLVFDGSLDEADAHSLQLVNDSSVLVINKGDTPGKLFHVKQLDGHDVIPVSVKNGDGIDALLKNLTGQISTLMGSARETPSLTRQRHRRALEECYASLEKALAAPQPELMAEELRLSVRALGRITGRVDVEDLLDVIFKDFCIGK